MTEGKCDLCGEEKIKFRAFTFGKMNRELCSDCLSHWEIENGRVVLI